MSNLFPHKKVHFKELFVLLFGTVLANKLLLAGTVQANTLLLAGNPEPWPNKSGLTGMAILEPYLATTENTA